jgi:hypothetical protein
MKVSFVVFVRALHRKDIYRYFSVEIESCVRQEDKPYRFGEDE